MARLTRNRLNKKRIEWLEENYETLTNALSNMVTDCRKSRDTAPDDAHKQLFAESANSWLGTRNELDELMNVEYCKYCDDVINDGDGEDGYCSDCADKGMPALVEHNKQLGRGTVIK